MSPKRTTQSNKKSRITQYCHHHTRHIKDMALNDNGSSQIKKPTTKRNHTHLVLYFKQPKSRVTKIKN